MKYTQNDEQQVILRHFNGKTGLLVDLGANDGKTFSNSRALLERGWRGHLIEPSKSAYPMAAKLYEFNDLVQVHQVAIADTTGKLILHESNNLVSEEDTALVSTLIESEKQRFASAVDFEEVTVEAFTWADFLKANKIKEQDIDFITMDIEGAEELVLPQMDLSSVKMFIIEYNMDKRKERLFTDYAAKFGLRLVDRNAENLIFTK